MPAVLDQMKVCRTLKVCMYDNLHLYFVLFMLLSVQLFLLHISFSGRFLYNNMFTLFKKLTAIVFSRIMCIRLMPFLCSFSDNTKINKSKHPM